MPRDGVRFVQIPITSPTDERPVDRDGSDRLMATLAALIRDAAAADAATAVVAPQSDDDSG